MSTVTARGLTFTGTGPYLLQAHEGLVGLPSLATADREPLGRHGLIFGSDWRRARIVDLELLVVGWSEAEFNTAVADLVDAFAEVSEEFELAVTMPGVARGNPVVLNVRAREFVAPGDHRWEMGGCEAAVQLVAADPYWRSAVEHVVTVTVAQAVVGRTYPWTPPRVYPDAGDQGIVSAFNAGSAPALPTLRIVGPATDPRVENQTTGAVVSFDLDLPAGQWLDVAYSNEALTVLLNGTVSRYSSLVESDVLELVPGANSLRFSADVATAAFLEVRWRDAWL